MDQVLSGTRIECRNSERFAGWMSTLEGSLAVTTYQAGKMALLSWRAGQLSLLMRQFHKAMCLAVAPGKMALATKHEITLLASAPLLPSDLLPDQRSRYDALYLPRVTYHTGDLNVHDVAFGDDGLWFVNSRFSCLSALSSDFSFVPRWQPRFISELVPEDRCHLNGLAMVNAKPKSTHRVRNWAPKHKRAHKCGSRKSTFRRCRQTFSSVPLVHLTGISLAHRNMNIVAGLAWASSQNRPSLLE